MKTKKVKGFTLIELIVVIAIIGVLAAILVPAMLGYVKKSKIQSANSAASTILKATNSALTELDELDLTYSKSSLGGGQLSHAAHASIASQGLSNASFANDAIVLDFMTSYFDSAVATEFNVTISNNVAVAAACKSGAYVGTSPTVYTNKNYPSTAPTVSAALALAVSKYNQKHSTNITVNG